MRQKKEIKHPDYELLSEKLLISRATTTEQFGSPNVFRAAQHFYAALYAPDKIEGLITRNEKYPDRMEVLCRCLTSAPAKIPTQEEFISVVRYVMVSKVSFEECCWDGALQQLSTVMEKSRHTVIWTDGDSIGVPEHELPGSKEQLKKLAVTKIYNRIRREIAFKRGVLPKEVMSVVAIEGKMNYIPKIAEMLASKNVSRVVIVEDRQKNLVLATQLIKRHVPSMEVIPVWVRIGQWKNKVEQGMTLDQCISELNAIEHISELTDMLKEKNVFDCESLGAIFDLDGPLHDDDKRKKVQTDVVLAALSERQWI